MLMLAVLENSRIIISIDTTSQKVCALEMQSNPSREHRRWGYMRTTGKEELRTLNLCIRELERGWRMDEEFRTITRHRQVMRMA
uniref:Uncharacterized protein n=1 Tax=Nelumbo nucifera TaxID=4432 RepID=A0A822Z7E8_NELNU|nr:TPA_asm: hypothetical protein HUJ06_013924 [Nelumbo nucifera]